MGAPESDTSEVLWALGDHWRDLAPDLATTPGPVTVVSVHGTARILDPEGWQTRIPLEGGHVMAGDLLRRHLASIVTATPCGVHTIDGRGGWHHTMPLILVLAGEHPRWLLSDVGRRTFAPARAADRDADGHPDEPCGALYCFRR